MSLSTTYFPLPHVSHYYCIDGVVKKLHADWKPSLANRVQKIALIALAEVAALFDLITYFSWLSFEVIKNLFMLNFKITPSIKELFFSTLRISYFFFAFIPHLIETRLQLKNLTALTEPMKTKEQQEIEKLKTKVEALSVDLDERKKELSSRCALEKKVLLSIQNFTELMDEKKPYLEKFSIDDESKIIPEIEKLIFWTCPQNHAYILSEQLSQDALEKCQTLNTTYRFILSLYKLFGKIYSFSSVLALLPILHNELHQLEKIIETKENEKNLHVKIFFTFRKVFTLYQMIQKKKEALPLGATPDELELMNQLMIHLYRLLNDHLALYHPNLGIEVTKPIMIKKVHLETYFAPVEEMETVIKPFIEFLKELDVLDFPCSNQANLCMRRSLEKCLKHLGD